MTGRINKPITFVLTGVVYVLFCTASASADIHVFFKRVNCPNLGTTAPIGSVTGIMQATTHPSGTGVGGPYCAQNSETVSVTLKAETVHNADVVAVAGDESPAIPGERYHCVICQYPDHVIQGVAIPALSLLGTAVLMGGLLTAGIYEIRRRQRKVTAA